MADSTSIKTRSGLTFTADVAGPIDGPLVLLLHGFPESRHSWRAALPALASAGYRDVANVLGGYGGAPQFGHAGWVQAGLPVATRATADRDYTTLRSRTGGDR